MNENLYQFNTLNNVLAYDEDLIFIENPIESFVIKGNGVKSLFMEILDEFKNPLDKHYVIDNLNKKYDLGSLKEAINLLIDKRVIIPSDADILSYSYSKEFLNKNTYDIELAIRHGIKLKETESLAIIGNEYLVLLILKNYLEEGKVSKIILRSNFSEDNIKEIDNLKVIYTDVDIQINCTNMENIRQLKDCLKEVDFIIAAVSKRKKHKLIEIHELMMELNKNWVRLFINEETIEIGPFFIPGISSCYKCLVDMFNSNVDTIEDIIYFNQVLPKLENEPSHISLSAAKVATSILNLELNKFKTTNQCDLINKIYSINMFNLDIEKIDIIKNLYCESCGSL